MPRWASSCSRVWLPALRFTSPRRRYSTVQRVNVTCASSGSISVHLHNIDQYHASHPLIIWIPPFPQEPGSSHNDPAALLPSWLRQFPTAVINYRWAGLRSQRDNRSQNEASDEAAPPSPLHWPAPLHDVMFGYSWIQKHLAPPDPIQRDIYVCSSYLGASLAAGLALTESHTSAQTSVKGLINFNGIYNWTTFLPDHPINKPKTTKEGTLSTTFGSIEPDENQSLFPLLHQQAPVLFNTPEHLFDPFASACLFFHSADLFVPTDFQTPKILSSMTQAIDALSNMSMSLSSQQHPRKMDGEFPSVPPIIEKPPRKGYLTFPPRQSTLVLPSTLLLHETTPPTVSMPRARGRGRPPKSLRFGGKYTGENNFQTQANELASFMKRSVNMFELKQRVKWDGGDEFDDDGGGVSTDEAEERVQVRDVGRLSSRNLDAAFGPALAGEGEGGGSRVQGHGIQDGGDFGLTPEGQEIVSEWLEDRM